ncbi:hypothetical protein IWX87_003796 [Polaromonas sp. CG_9.7]|nr:hypothetical protein [Polaromonas sp. CG_9.7]MBG6116032.1 hypothetical protein [Polaromonas sp. CG_9.2]
MLQHFALPTGTAAVCYDSHSLSYAVAFIGCATLQQALHEAVQRNRKSVRCLAQLPQQGSAKFERCPARFFESEAA